MVGKAAHVRPCRLMAEDQRIRLAAVDQSKRYAGIGGMEQRALAFDQVPVILVIVR